MKLTKILITCFLLLPCFASAGTSVNYQQQALSAHNKYRALHHAQTLVWDDKLASYALRHAKKCQFEHSHSPYGENLAAGYPTISRAINAWYVENEHYSYMWPGFSMKTGHFTQMVWKSTTRLGCAYVSCYRDSGREWKYLVCEYSPRGNVTNGGYFRANVLPA